MSKKKNVKTEVPKVVEVVVTRAHCLEPHSIELRKNADGQVIDARTEDWKHTYTVGAKTVAQFLAESGVAVPDSEETELVIRFSPANGEVITVEPKPMEVIETEEPPENKEGDETIEPA